jgi:hypothetical protein
VKKNIWCPESSNALTWTLHDCGHTQAKLLCNKYRTYSERLTPLLVKEKTPLQTHKWSWNKQKFEGLKTKNDCGGKGQQQFAGLA